MIYLIFTFLSGLAALYCIAAILLKIPAFKAAKAFRKSSPWGKSGTVKLFVSDAAKRLARVVPMGRWREMEMAKMLRAANADETPREYMARIFIESAPFLLLCVPAYIANPILALLPVVFTVFLFVHKYGHLSRMGDQRRREMEKELPRFVSYMANSLKSSRNVLDLMGVYRANYRTPLTDELAITAADMRTGNAETALRRLESRVNSPYMSELVRGLLSAMRGDDMTAYFDNLSEKLSNVWEQRLRLQAMKKEPKIMRMAYLVFACAAVTIVIVMAAALGSAASMFGGMT